MTKKKGKITKLKPRKSIFRAILNKTKENMVRNTKKLEIGWMESKMTFKRTYKYGIDM